MNIRRTRVRSAQHLIQMSGATNDRQPICWVPVKVITLVKQAAACLELDGYAVAGDEYN